MSFGPKLRNSCSSLVEPLLPHQYSQCFAALVRFYFEFAVCTNAVSSLPLPILYYWWLPSGTPVVI